MHASKGAPMHLQIMLPIPTCTLCLWDMQVWNEGQEYGHGITTIVLWQFIRVETPLLNEFQKWAEWHCMHFKSGLYLHKADISHTDRPCGLCSIDSLKQFFASRSSANASLNDQAVIWKVNNTSYGEFAHVQETKPAWYEVYYQTKCVVRGILYNLPWVQIWRTLMWSVSKSIE